MRKSGIFKTNLSKKLNFFVLHVSLPALTLLYVPKSDFGLDMWFPLSISPLILATSFLFFYLFGKLWKADKKTRACLILVCGLGNTSFVGFPMTEAFFGSEGMKTAILIDQSSFFALTFIGVPYAMISSEGKVRSEAVFKRLLTFPPFLAFVLSLFLAGFDFNFSDSWENFLRILGMTLSPFALTSVGFQLNIREASFKKELLFSGLIYKLLLAPAMIGGLYLLFFSEIDLRGQVCVLEAAMPCMVTASVIASEYDLRPELSVFLVGISLLIVLPISVVAFLVIG
jgi:predicted permease